MLGFCIYMCAHTCIFCIFICTYKCNTIVRIYIYMSVELVPRPPQPDTHGTFTLSSGRLLLVWNHPRACPQHRNNCGINIRKRAEDFTQEEFARIFNTNFMSCMWLSKAALPLLRKAHRERGSGSGRFSSTGSVEVAESPGAQRQHPFVRSLKIRPPRCQTSSYHSLARPSASRKTTTKAYKILPIPLSSPGGCCFLRRLLREHKVLEYL